MKKAVFFDADGTFTSIKNGTPASSVKALEKLRSNGHYSFLCTGRSRAMIPEHLADSGFDGIVAACGTYIEYNGKVIYNQELDRNVAKNAVQIIRSHGMIPIMEGARHLYYDVDEYNDSVDWIAPYIREILGNNHRSISENLEHIEANKITTKILPGSDPDGACRQLSPLFSPILHTSGFVSSTIEFVPTGHTKATGMEKICRMIRMDMKDTVCFGDSSNDLSMFEHAGTSVAMGNASPDILSLASLVTDDLEHDGVYHALEKLQLI